VLHACLVHQLNSQVCRQFGVGHLLSGPAPQRLEHLVTQEAQSGVLHPDIDGHDSIFFTFDA
jgi:hypothetical protein